MPKSSELVSGGAKTGLGDAEVPGGQLASEKDSELLEGVSPFERPSSMGRQAYRTGGDRVGQLPCTRPLAQAHQFIQQTYMGIAGCEALCRMQVMAEAGSALLAQGEFLGSSGVWRSGPRLAPGDFCL